MKVFPQNPPKASLIFALGTEALLGTSPFLLRPHDEPSLPQCGYNYPGVENGVQNGSRQDWEEGGGCYTDSKCGNIYLGERFCTWCFFLHKTSVVELS